MTTAKVIEIFCFLDEFCKYFEPELQKRTIPVSGKRHWNRPGRMSDSEIRNNPIKYTLKIPSYDIPTSFLTDQLFGVNCAHLWYLLCLFLLMAICYPLFCLADKSLYIHIALFFDISWYKLFRHISYTNSRYS